MTSRLLRRGALLAAALAFLAAPSVTHADPYTITGSTAGVFSTPHGTLGYSPSYNSDHSKIEWGNVLTGGSSLQYTSSPNFTANAGEAFVLGQLTLENWHWLNASQLSSVALQITLNLITPPVTGEGLGTGSLALASQQLFFGLTNESVALPSASSFNSVSFASGGVEYTLDVLGFGKMKNGSFDPISSINDTNLPGSGSVNLYGKFTAVAAVPEPSSIAVVAVAGLFGLGHVIRRRRRDAANA